MQKIKNQESQISEKKESQVEPDDVILIKNKWDRLGVLK